MLSQCEAAFPRRRKRRVDRLSSTGNDRPHMQQIADAQEGSAKKGRKGKEGTGKEELPADTLSRRGTCEPELFN